MKLYLQQLSSTTLNNIKTQFILSNINVHFKKYFSDGYIYFTKSKFKEVIAILNTYIIDGVQSPILTNCTATVSFPYEDTTENNFTASCNVNLNGNTLSDYGFIYYYINQLTRFSNSPQSVKLSLFNIPNTFINNMISINDYILDFSSNNYFNIIFIQAYCQTQTSNIYSYSEMTSSFYGETCLSENTKITLSDGSTKNIADVSYDDELMVWKFDDAILTSAKPLWIKKVETTSKYNLLEFSDGSFLETINQHRIFNVEKGTFTYPMTDDTPINTTTFSLDELKYVKLISKKVIEKPVKFYNIITNYHINLFANNILTSCRYNNIYPISNMKFVKTMNMNKNKVINDIPQKYIDGLRLNEQQMDLNEHILYIKRLEHLKK